MKGKKEPAILQNQSSIGNLPTWFIPPLPSSEKRTNTGAALPVEAAQENFHCKRKCLMKTRKTARNT